MVRIELSLCLLVSAVVALAISGLQAIGKMSRRETNLMEGVYTEMSRDDRFFIHQHLNLLTLYNGSDCEQCKNKIRYGRKLLDEQPDKEHLISLLLFEYCLVQNDNTERKCDNVDFFVTTGTNVSLGQDDSMELAASSGRSVNFYDNDFLQMLKNFNVSSDSDLEYYCYFKSSEACDLPEPVDVNERFDLQSRWPEKQAKHYSEPEYSNNTKERFNVLHLSDSHIELRYQIGSEANCSHGICCLPESINLDLTGKKYNFTDSYFQNVSAEESTDIDYSFYPDAHYENDTYVKGDYFDYPSAWGYNAVWLPASTFGAYACDPPEILLNNTLKHVRKFNQDKQFEFTIFTGDLVDHDVLHCDPATTKKAELESFQIMKDYLGTNSIYITLGNHDTFPYGQIAPIKFDFENHYNWNEELLNKLWIDNGYIPENSTGNIETHYAGFSVETSRGLKIISLNSNAYYQKNLWAYINLLEEFDPFEQWQFLIDELVDSEENDQRVWIMAHIPTNTDDALPTHARIFNEIVDRFSPYTIANIFFGHTHRDQFHILYRANSSKEASDIIQMSWVTHSITPDADNNPSWRYYEVEDESFNVMNSYNYYTKLNETFINGGDEPEWNLEYSARELYDPESTWPEDAPLNATFWHTYVASNLRDETNIEFNQLYSDIQYRLSPYAPSCDDDGELSSTCYEDNWCDVSSSTVEDRLNCTESYSS